MANFLHWLLCAIIFVVAYRRITKMNLSTRFDVRWATILLAGFSFYYGFFPVMEKSFKVTAWILFFDTLGLALFLLGGWLLRYQPPADALEKSTSGLTPHH